jgi:hypothetical protein
MTSQDPWRSRKGPSAANTDVEAIAGQVNGRAALVRLLERKDRNQMLAVGGEPFLKGLASPSGSPTRACVRKGLIRRAPFAIDPGRPTPRVTSGMAATTYPCFITLVLTALLTKA